MDLPERKPTDEEIRTALEDVRRIGSDIPASASLEATANVLVDAARLASRDLDRMADRLGDCAPAISAGHDAFLACAVLNEGAVLHADAALGGGAELRGCAD